METLGDFDKWVIDALANDDLDICVIDIQNGQELPTFKMCLGVIVTGAHAMVTDELAWSVEIEKWIPSLINNNVPYLGICYGHQLLAKAMDGVSGYHPNGMEIGTVDIVLNENAKTDKIFATLPNDFQVHTIHSQTVLKLPQNSTVLAENKHDKYHAIRVGDSAWGVQFHPEYSTKVMCSYIEEVLKENSASQSEIQGLIATVKDTQYSAKVLKNFGEFILNKL